jgi:hypothetical protein
MKIAKNAAPGAVLATLVTLVAPATVAGADRGDTLKGGCGLTSVQQEIATNGAADGFFVGLTVAQEASGAPAGATITCWIDVNGVEQPGTRMTFRSGQAASTRVSYITVDGDKVTVCMHVTFDDGSTWTARDGNVGTDCAAATEGDGSVLKIENGQAIDYGVRISDMGAGPIGRPL